MGCLGSDKVIPSDMEMNGGNHENYKRNNRATTDVCFLLLFTIFLTVLLIFLGYCVFYGDIFRTINGYDNCGNVCGRKKFIDADVFKNLQDPCLQQDEHIGSYLIVIKQSDTINNRTCVDDCTKYPGYRKFLNRCIPNKKNTEVNKFFSKTGLRNFFTEAAEDFHLCWPEICYLCLIALVLSITMLILFRYLIGFVVWLLLISVVVASIAGSVFLWLLWRKSRDDSFSIADDLIPDIDRRKTGTYLAFAIAATFVTIVVVLIIFVMRKRIKLVVQLFKEAGKAIAAMPLLLLEPVLTFLCLAIIISLWFYFCLWIESSGFLTEERNHVYYYKKDFLMKFTRWYNFLAMFWATQFVIGCQHMVIAGAVSIWYFSRDKSTIDSPILQSAYNLSRYHLGSVAIGSFLIAILQFARLILKTIDKQLNKNEGSVVNCLSKSLQCCLYCFERIIKFLSRNAYIEVAIHGYNFCDGAKQAFKLLSSNALRVAAINSVGDFVLFLGKILVVMATVLIGVEMLKNKEGIQHLWIPLTLVGLFAYFVSHCFMTVYEMAIDTIFLCFCEDCEENDGESKPYFMSVGLMEFVQNSTKAIEALKSRKYNQNIRTISSDIDSKTV